MYSSYKLNFSSANHFIVLVGEIYHIMHEWGTRIRSQYQPLLACATPEKMGGQCKCKKPTQLLSTKILASNFCTTNQKSWKNKLVEPSANDLMSAGFTTARHKGQVLSLSNLKRSMINQLKGNQSITLQRV